METVWSLLPNSALCVDLCERCPGTREISVDQESWARGLGTWVRDFYQKMKVTQAEPTDSAPSDPLCPQ